jgi:hypothetical protein
MEGGERRRCRRRGDQHGGGTAVAHASSGGISAAYAYPGREETGVQIPCAIPEPVTARWLDPTDETESPELV